MMIYLIVFTLEFLYDISIYWSMYLLVLQVFGYEVKVEKQLRRIVTVLCPVMAAMTVVEWTMEGKVLVTNNMIGMFLLILYIGCAMKEKRWKAFMISFSSAIIVSSFQLIVSGIIGGAVYDYLGDTLRIYCLFFGNVFLGGVMFIFGEFARKKRKQKISLTGIILLLFVSRLLIFFVEWLKPIGFDTSQEVLEQFGNNSQNLYYTYSLIVYAIVFMIVIFLFVILIRDTKTSYYQRMSIVNENYLEAQKKHYDELVKSNMNIRRMRHDMRGHIFCMNELLDRKDYDELAKYIHTLSEEFAKSEIKVRVGNDIADAIIAEKMQQAEKQHIKIEVDGDMSGIQIAAIDLCTILANILDNAIEAVKTDEVIHLSFQKTENFLLITQTNPVAQKRKIVDGMIISSKTDQEMHGFGIANIKSAVARYDGECEISCEEIIRERNDENKNVSKCVEKVVSKDVENVVGKYISKDVENVVGKDVEKEVNQKTKKEAKHEANIDENNEANKNVNIDEMKEAKKDANKEAKKDAKIDAKIDAKRYEFKIEIMIPRE